MRSLEQSETSRSFLQRRIANYGLQVGLIGLGFFVMRAGLVTAFGDFPHLIEPGAFFHLGGAGAFLMQWMILRRSQYTPRVIHLVEMVCFAVGCICYRYMTDDLGILERPELILVSIFSLTLTARAIYVPTTWQRTAALGLVMGLAIVDLAYHVWMDVDAGVVAASGYGSVSIRAIRISSVVVVIMWWAAGVGLAATASTVIYGLRREVSEVRRLGQYELIRKIGAGGMGTVYEASHAMLRRPTAVKVLQPERVGQETIARFEREVQATSKLAHTNTVTVFDYGRTPDGLFYYAMEFIDGPTLTRLPEIEGPLPAARVASILHQVASALSEAHGLGLIHRDIKPDNILLCEQGGVPDVAKVVDFGLVKELSTDAELTHNDRIVGTPLYLAPEAISQGANSDPRSDIYALGAVGYFLLTGEHVFKGATIVEICSKHLTETPETPSERLGHSVPRDIEELIMLCLLKRPEDRPQTAQALMEAIEDLECFGRWTRRDAARWWNLMGSDARSHQDEQLSSLDTRTIAVDLGRRS